jgi:hypothetical protein
VDGEFVAIEWMTLDQTRRQGAANITKIILDDLQRRLETGLPGDHNAPVPFYFMRGACFHRIML